MQRNIYGDISGGWIFDQLDRYAHELAIQSIGSCVTASANINYLGVVHHEGKLGATYRISHGENKISIGVTYSELGEVKATASFLFIKRK